MPLLLPLDLWGDIGNFFNTIMQPLYWAVSGILIGFHWLFSQFMAADSGWTWALSIILLTALIRTALIPLFVKQINSSRNMQLLAPKQKELQDKYGHDRERLGQETMKLYQEEGVNPMASCLPLLLQMPIFMSLFWVLNNAARGQAMGMFVDHPELMDSLRNATIFGARISGTFWPIPDTGWSMTQTLATILVLAMTAVLYVTQLQLMRKNMPPAALTGPMAQQQKMMLYVFPLMYLFTGVNIPIGVLIYWLTTNTWNMVQQYLLIHNNPSPGTPAYLDWEDRMRARGKDPDEIVAQRRGKQRKRPAATADYDPTKVTRQNTTTRPASSGQASNRSTPRPTNSPATAAAGNDKPTSTGSPDGQRTVVQRQQPKRNPRAQRKS
ncbi:MAG: membrane protein insertase YidC [Propionicimonas sp.]|nr:membrane protein insertase YidC [Propionicimonas sp.]